MFAFVLGLILGVGLLFRLLRGRDLRMLATFGLLGRLGVLGGLLVILGAALLAGAFIGLPVGVLALGLCGFGLTLLVVMLVLGWRLRAPQVRELAGEGALLGAVEGVRRVPGGLALRVQGREVSVPVRGSLGPHVGSAASRLPRLLVLADGTLWTPAFWGEGRAGGRRYAPVSPYLAQWLLPER